MATTTQHVDVGLHYQGRELFLFGQVSSEVTNVVAVLQSRRKQPLKFVRKVNTYGLWFAAKEFEVRDLPDVYMINFSSTARRIKNSADSVLPVSETEEKLRFCGGVGYESLKRDMQVELIRGTSDEDDRDALFQGILQMKEKAGLYALRPNEIHLGSTGLLYHSFMLPDSAPEGRYEITTYALGREGLLAKRVGWFVIRKAGTVAYLANLAQRHSLTYGLLTAMIAMSAGLLAGMLFKKEEGH